ncbi:MAG TPA: ATP-grasp domain-containing protein [Thermodesulfobacteriota bacterium]
MQLREAVAKRYLKAGGVSVPEGHLCRSGTEAREAARTIGLPVAVKAQLKQWGRGKAGLVRRCETLASVEEAFASVQRSATRDEGRATEPVACLVERWIPGMREVYLAEMVDPEIGGSTLLFSRSGGVDIEAASALARLLVPVSTGVTPFHVRRVLADYGLPGTVAPDLGRLLASVNDLFTQWDMRLLEINPLGWSVDAGFVALDAKIVVDDNALARHPELGDRYREEAIDDPSDELRIEHGIEYVALDGEVGLISGGAGMTMAVMDLIGKQGGRPRCFLDCSQNATSAGYGHALDTLFGDPRTRSVLVNIVGGGTQVDQVASIFVDLLAARRRAGELPKPFFIRLEGTNSDLAKEILRANGLPWFDSLEEAVASAVRAAAVSV